MNQEFGQEFETPTMYSKILKIIIDNPLSRKEISLLLGQKQISVGLNRALSKLLEDNLVEYTIKDTTNHPDQKIRISKRGIMFLDLLKK